ncbi:MAG: hypothetical protein GF331_03725 [Chitinivibrionales bacterium]|nr:hypothetical protein [Chitinivibrionales bacterium]
MARTGLLRAGYWAGAIADFGLATMALFPRLAGVEQYVYPMGLLSAAAFSWGIMLLIADRRPIERRWVIVPTIIVVALIGVATTHAMTLEGTRKPLLAGGLIADVSLLLLMTAGLVCSRGRRVSVSQQGELTKQSPGSADTVCH